MLPGRGMLIRALAPETTVSTNVTTRGLWDSALKTDAGTYDNSFLDKASLQYLEQANYDSKPIH